MPHNKKMTMHRAT